MIRHVAAIALAMCLNPSWLFAQTARLTVGVQSADVHKNPSMGSPVIGHAALGTSLEIKRDLGSWVAVAWPSGDYGVGYMHVLTGTIARDALSTNPNDPLITPVFSSAPPKSARNARPETPRNTKSSPEETPRSTRSSAEAADPSAAPAPNAAVAVTTSRFVGLGGRIGAAGIGAGVSVRAWRQDRFGFQVATAHVTRLSAYGPGDLTSTAIEPSVLYAFNDRVRDSLWMRPFLGLGVSVRHQTVSPDSVFGASVSESRFGGQMFGGLEFAMAAAPRFTLGSELSYRWAQNEVPGFDLGGAGISLSAHWYIR